MHYEYVPKNQINGAGPRCFGWCVRDRIGNICITEAANIHDAYYYQGKISRRYADQTFLRNMKVIIDYKARGYWHKTYCKAIAYSYYKAVRLFGGAFYKRS